MKHQIILEGYEDIPIEGTLSVGYKPDRFYTLEIKTQPAVLINGKCKQNPRKFFHLRFQENRKTFCKKLKKVQ